ncbi:hypothetical protein BC628DRAFT_1339957 [Trametes gibbosa]|nr:hypothetical protein BC628DRAFT_1339957 [Trametes gibbosa]
MKFFANVLPAAAVAAAFALGVAAQDFTAVLGSVNGLIQQAQEVGKHLKRVTPGNIQNQGQGVAPAIDTLTANIINQINNVFIPNESDNQKPLNERDSATVAFAFQELTQQEENIIGTLLDDYSLFSKNNFVEFIIKSVREFRTAVTGYTGFLKAAAEPSSDTILAAQENLDNLFEAFVQLYEG